jgi:hypothetical protein
MGARLQDRAGLQTRSPGPARCVSVSAARRAGRRSWPAEASRCCGARTETPTVPRVTNCIRSLLPRPPGDRFLPASEMSRPCVLWRPSGQHRRGRLTPCRRVSASNRTGCSDRAHPVICWLDVGYALRRGSELLLSSSREALILSLVTQALKNSLATRRDSFQHSCLSSDRGL